MLWKKYPQIRQEKLSLYKSCSTCNPALELFCAISKHSIYIIYDPDSNKEHRDIYDLELRKVVDNTVVYLRWIESKDMSCPLKSQLFRLWAFQEDVVKDNDIIVTVDANLFVMTSDILNPIFHYPNMKIWIFQYDRAENKEEGYGNTFNQNLIAARPKGKTLFSDIMRCYFYNLKE